MTPQDYPDSLDYEAARNWTVGQPDAWTLDEVASSCLHWLLGYTAKEGTPARAAAAVAGIRDGLAARAEGTR